MERNTGSTDCLDGLVLSKALNVQLVLLLKSRNDMEAVETIEIKALIVSKSTYLNGIN